MYEGPEYEKETQLRVFAYCTVAYVSILLAHSHSASASTTTTTTIRTTLSVTTTTALPTTIKTKFPFLYKQRISFSSCRKSDLSSAHRPVASTFACCASPYNEIPTFLLERLATAPSLHRFTHPRPHSNTCFSSCHHPSPFSPRWRPCSKHPTSLLGHS